MSDIKISGGTFNQPHIGDVNQTQNIGAGATVGTVSQTSAPVTNVRAEVDKELDALRAAVEELTASLPPKEAQKVKDDLAELEKQAKSDEPRRRWFDVSAEGLVDAAKAVAGLVDPISTSVAALAKLLFV
ncbi:MAG TPA: hypothetical protein VEK57_08270 [Thermoanaerobaculia bacterium]|nr:hypothetical protein [Thermoanaerobaculia bacterium]